LNLHFDTAYVAKCYINEADSTAVRKIVKQASGLYASPRGIAEMRCVFQRQVREFKMPGSEASQARISAGDAIHLTSAPSARFDEIWSNDRRIFEAAPAFGLKGKTV